MLHVEFLMLWQFFVLIFHIQNSSKHNHLFLLCWPFPSIFIIGRLRSLLTYFRFTYLLTSGLFTYFPTSGLLTSGYLFTYFLFTYLVTSSSGSWHDTNLTCQEGGHICELIAAFVVIHGLWSFLADVYGHLLPLMKISDGDRKVDNVQKMVVFWWILNMKRLPTKWICLSVLILLCRRPGGIKRWCCLTSVWRLSRSSGRRAACVAGRLDGPYWLIRLGRPGSRLPLHPSVAGLVGGISWRPPAYSLF